MSGGRGLFDLEGRRALVTGASRGIGRAIAVGLAEHGADVMCVARGEEGLKETVGEVAGVGRRGELLVADLSERDAPAWVVAETLGRLGGLDVLVNNAAGGHYTAAIDTDAEVWDRVLALDLRASFLLCREAGRHLVAQGRGKVINVASILGLAGDRHQAAYVAAKTGLVGLTRALALEWARSGVQVNALAPGFVVTDMTRRSFEDPRVRDWVEQRTPMGRWGRPEDLVGAAVFLASPASDFVTGHVLVVDGGWLAQ